MVAPSIGRAAAVDPTSNWPQLIGGRVVGARLGQVTIEHELSYDVLVGDEIELRGLICRPASECRRGQQRGGSDRHDPYLAEHLTLPSRTNFRYAAGTEPAAYPAIAWPSTGSPPPSHVMGWNPTRAG